MLKIINKAAFLLFQLFFTDFSEVGWDGSFIAAGCLFIVIPEAVSLYIDLANASFQYENPTTCLKNEEVYQRATCARKFEFVGGIIGMTAGFVLSHLLSNPIEQRICPGMKTLIISALGIPTIGILLGSFAGFLGKILGNAFGIYYFRRNKRQSKCGLILCADAESNSQDENR